MADNAGSRSAHSPQAGGSQQGSHRESIRWSQYAENRPNPLPELAVDQEPAPELVSNLEELKTQEDANPLAGLPVARPPGLIQPDGGDQRSAAVVFKEPERSWIAKHKSWAISGLLLVVMILVGTVIGVVIGTHEGYVYGGGPT